MLEAPRYLPGLKPVLETLTTIPKSIDLVLLRKGLDTREIHVIQTLCHQHGIKLSRVAGEVLDKLCQRAPNLKPSAHQGVLARLSQTQAIDLKALIASCDRVPLPLILALDQIQDPGNLGTLARTLYCLGGLGLLVPLHNTAALGPTAEKCAAGALTKLPVCRETNLAHALDDLEEAGFNIYGATPKKQQALNAFTTKLNLPAVLVLGNEARGIRPGVLKRCQLQLYIPQARPFDSLNVAQAGAIIMGLVAASSL